MPEYLVPILVFPNIFSYTSHYMVPVFIFVPYGANPLFSI
jgi:hypothetical protein